MSHSSWEPVIGLEIHVQLNTKSKLFSSAPNHFGDEPNINISSVCTGQPGALPVLLLMVIGSLNWGLIGFFQYDLISDIFGGMGSSAARFIFSIVGIAGLLGISALCRSCCSSGCGGCGCGPSCRCKKD